MFVSIIHNDSCLESVYSQNLEFKYRNNNTKVESVSTRPLLPTNKPTDGPEVSWGFTLPIML